MAESRETRVFYKAVADFANLRKELKNVRSELAKTKAAEKAYNAASTKDRVAATKASKARAKALADETASIKNSSSRAKHIKALRDETVATDKATKSTVRFVEEIGHVDHATGEVVTSIDSATAATSRWSNALTRTRGYFRNFLRDSVAVTRAQEALNRARMRQDDTADRVRIAEIRLADAIKKSGDNSGPAIIAQANLNRARRSQVLATDAATAALVRFRREGVALPPILRNIDGGGNRLFRTLQRFGNWRPRLTPPFIALIPIIGSVIAALNPLVALLGAVGMAAFGLASNIGSLSGAFIALPGILSAVVAGIGSVIASMGGVGNVFKTYSAMQKALGKTPASGGQTQADRADQLADAERGLARAQRSVQKAQENLNKAREEALKDLIELRLEVSRASLDEERAIANLVLAREEYNNVFADPGSTAGDKLDAAAAVKEAQQDLDDVRRQAVENQNALTEAERKGVEQSDKVVNAQENLADAIEAQRNAQRSMQLEAAGGSAAVTAVNEYNEALAQLSPSARTFVLALIAMQDQWKSFQRDMQENFFSQFTSDLDRLPRILNSIANFLRPAAVAMGQFTSALLTLLDSPEWSRDLKTIGEQNGSVIENLGKGFLFLITAFKDIVIAAGPFTDWMTNGFAEGSANFADFIANARETGSLANWLETVEKRLRKWWDIIKNIAGTLFNYGAASSAFGDWISDGLLEMSQNWLKAAEAARDPNSKFQQYLEDIKPLLEEVDGLLGDFFGWFSREASEEGNIDSARELVAIIRNDLGPALGRLFDTLAETEIDEKLVEAFTSIVESIDTILENGGSAAFEAFFDVVTGAFSLMADAFERIPEPILKGLLGLLGLIAGAAFVGKFTGLTALLGTMLRFTPTLITGLSGVFASFKGIDGLKFLGAIALIAGLVGLAAANGPKAQQFGLDFWGGLNGNTRPEDAARGMTTDGALAKNLGNIPGTGLNAAGFAGNPLGPIAELLHLFDSFTGASWGTEFDNFLEDISKNFVSWSGGFATNWDNFWKGRADWIGTSWDNIQTEWGNFWRDFNLGWATISAGFKLGWDRFWGAFPTAFQSIVDQLGTIWSGIQNLFATPVNWVITNVWNRGIAAFWNNIADKLGLAKLDTFAGIGAPAPVQRTASGRPVNAGMYAEGGVLPGYTPGRDVHDFYSPTGGRLKLSGGEAIMRPEFTKLMGGKAGIDEINKKARRGQAFASGGVWGDLGNAVTSIFRSANPAKFVGDGLKAAVSPLMAGMSDNGWSGMLKQVPNKLIDGLVKTVKDIVPDITGGGAAPANVMGWQSQWSAVKGAFPDARLNSAFRPGDPLYHGKGRAIDVSPSMAIFNWIRQNYPNSRELIYTPAGGRQLQNGQNHVWRSEIARAHYDHVHWAMKNGGVFDRGGWMQPGQAAFNFTNKPEAVLDPDESRGLKSLLSGSGLRSSLPALGASPATGMVSAPAVVDNSINIDNVIMNNPVPEKVSTSLPKAIRQIGYMNQARDSR